MAESILQAIFSGLALGSIYALVAVGFNITFNTTKTLNFGQGEFLVAGAFVAVSVLLLLAGKQMTDALLPAEVTMARYLLSLVGSMAVLLTLDWVMRRTKIGKAVRAVAQNGAAATLMGINVSAIVVLAVVISSSLAGLAGLLIAPITTASVFMGMTLALKAFSSAILGGLTSPRGCMLGGFILGVIEALVGLWHAELREISIFLLIIVVLVVRPQGLLGQRIVEKV